MMESLRTYLLSVTAAAVLCGMVMSLLGKKGTIAALGKFLAGLFLSLTVIAPVVNFSTGDWSSYWQTFSLDGQDAAQAGIMMAQSAQADIIKQNLEAYILDKAASMGADLTVAVTLRDGDVLTPTSVRLSGQVSPYIRQQLSAIITEELGIAKEAQEWINQP